MIAGLLLLSPLASADITKTPVVCLTGNTSIFFAKQKTCASIDRQDEFGRSFLLHGLHVGAETNPETRPTVVFVPGGPGDSGADLFQSFESRSFPGAFQKHLNVNTIFYDPRGTGNSKTGPDFEKLTHKTFSTENNVEDLKALLDYFGVEKNVILLAHSAGGAVATRFAEKYPEVTSGLILYSAVSSLRTTGLIIKNYEGEKFDLWKTALSRRGVAETELTQLEDLYQSVEREIINEKLLWIQGKISEVTYSKKSVFVFRHMAHHAALKGLEAFQNFLAEPLARIRSTPLPLRAEPITEDVLFSKEINSPLHLRSVLFCAEALDQQDINEAFFYPGVQLSYLCKNKVVHAQAVNPPDLRRLNLSTLVLTGELDTYVPALLQKSMAEQFTKASYVEISGAGHTFHNTHPMPFLNAIDSFLTHF
jgi:pimeloyl-ACP methyl ester carboxylesterase